MSDTDQSVSVAPLLTTVIIIAACTSALWLYFWQTHDQARAQQLESLTAELEQRRNTEAGLLTKYSTAEEARRRSEQALLDIRNRLEVTEQALAQLESANWEERYRAATAENYELSERIVELELRHAIARDHIETEHNHLLDTHVALEQAFAALQSEYAELQQTHQELETTLASQQQLEHAFVQLELEHADALDELNELREQQQVLEQSLAESRRELEQAQREREQVAVAEQQTQEMVATPATAGPVAAANASPGYRVVRLQSLGNAMQGRSSGERRSILTTVIPTIPDGIDGTELLELVAGMNSTDIMQVIQTTRQHINTPLNSASLDLIMVQLDETDAQNVLELLGQ